jgi:hypothetical protein
MQTRLARGEASRLGRRTHLRGYLDGPVGNRVMVKELDDDQMLIFLVIDLVDTGCRQDREHRRGHWQ